MERQFVPTPRVKVRGSCNRSAADKW